MRKTIAGSAAVIGLLFFVVAQGALAGTRIEIETQYFEQSKAAGIATIYLDGKRMRIDSTEGGGNYTVIYRTDGKTPTYWVVDRAAKTYVELTEEDLELIKGQTEMSRRQIEQQLEELPPEQRAALEPMYRDRIEALVRSGAPTAYRKVSSGTRVGKWTCDHYEGYDGDTKVEEVWATTFETLGVSKKDLAAFGDLATALERSGQPLPAFFYFGRDAIAGEHGLSGFPVMVLSYQGERRKDKSELKGVLREAFDPQLFELPEGLTRRKVNQRP